MLRPHDSSDRFQMVNISLDDVQGFILTVNRYFNADEYEEAVNLPAPNTAIQILLQVKESLNEHELLQRYAPRSLIKVGIRLIKFVLGLERLCRRGLLPNYPRTLVQDVDRRPQLSATAMNFVWMLLDQSYLRKAWLRLGESWQSDGFTHTAEHAALYLSDAEFQRRSNAMGSEDYMSSVGTRGDAIRPKWVSQEEHEYFSKLDRNGARICFALDDHETDGVNEMSADAGQVFQIIDASSDKYFFVRSYDGREGNLPSAKVRTFIVSTPRPVSYNQRYSTLTDRSARRTPFSLPRSENRPSLTDPLYADITSYSIDPAYQFCGASHDELPYHHQQQQQHYTKTTSSSVRSPTWRSTKRTPGRNTRPSVRPVSNSMPRDLNRSTASPVFWVPCRPVSPDAYQFIQSEAPSSVTMRNNSLPDFFGLKSPEPAGYNGGLQVDTDANGGYFYQPTMTIKSRRPLSENGGHFKF